MDRDNQQPSLSADQPRRERLDDEALFALNSARLSTEPYRQTIDAVNALGFLHRVSPTGYVVLIGIENDYAFDPLSGAAFIRGMDVEFEGHEDFLALVFEMEDAVRERLESES